jgi:hypothetical protein
MAPVQMTLWPTRNERKQLSNEENEACLEYSGFYDGGRGGDDQKAVLLICSSMYI